VTLTLQPITSHWVNRTHRNDPTPGIPPRDVNDEDIAQETAVRLLQAYHSISYLQLLDGEQEVAVYRRGDFFYRDSPLRHVRQRVTAARIARNGATQ
jgi:hypothetical protein